MRRTLKYAALGMAFMAALSLSTVDTFAQGKGGGNKGGGAAKGGGGDAPKGGGGASKGGGGPSRGGNPGGGARGVPHGGSAPAARPPAGNVRPGNPQVRTPSFTPPRVNPPATVARPQPRVNPPTVTSRPPVSATAQPPVVARPPVRAGQPPASVRPPNVAANPPGKNVRPPATNVRPPNVAVNPPGNTVRPPNNDGRPSLNVPGQRGPNVGVDGRTRIDAQAGNRPGSNPGRPAFQPNTGERRGPDGRGPDGRGPDGRGPDGRFANDGRDGRDFNRDGNRDGRDFNRDGNRDGRDFDRDGRRYAGPNIRVGDRNLQFANQNYRPAYARHPSFYRGYWNGNRGFGNQFGNQYGVGYRGGYGGWGYGGYGQGGIGLSLAQLGLSYALGGRGGLGGYGGYGGYGYSPLGWGMGGWGLGSMAYGSGYLPYSNPYFVGGGNSIYNYAQPIPVSYNTVVTTETAPAGLTADDVLNAAVAAFQVNDYDKALDTVDQGIKQFPDDSVLHEFRSLVLFARQDFQQSAATIHSVLAVGPGWNWTTMSGLYGDIGLYTTQLRSLEAYTQQNPQDSASRFLLAYHYMIGGHNDAVAKQLTKVVALTPNDRVAQDLLRMVTPPATFQEGEPAQAPIPQVAEAELPKVDPQVLYGNWTATREGGAKFSLNLDKDNTFKWVYAEGNQPATQFEGKYTMEGNVIALERKDGGSLIAQVTPEAEGKFNFRLVGAPKEDTGLIFVR